MTQPHGSFLIRDANGQPQMVKVVHAKQTGGHIQLPSSAMKAFFKQPSEGTTATRSISITGIKSEPKYVQVPIETLSQYQKISGDSANQTTPVVKKIQTIKVSDVSKMIKTAPTLVQQTPRQSSPLTVTVKTENEDCYISNSILGYGNRKRHESDSDLRLDYTSKRRKVVDKVGKGLRHFSMKVCEKVRKKVLTSYNEVADELVAEFAENSCPDSQHYDQKNIRRRVYDALNVLMAMNIISKEKKEIRWLGLPTNSVQEFTALQAEKKSKIERIQQKTQQLNDLILKQISFKTLVERNKEAEKKGLTPTSKSTIQLPFIILNTSDKTLINCNISNDKMQYVFKFNDKFLIQDDFEILKKMNLLLGLDTGNCTGENLKKAKSMVPRSLECYIDQMANGEDINIHELLKDKGECEELGEGSGNGEEEMEDYDDGFSGAYTDDGEEDQDSCSDIDIN